MKLKSFCTVTFTWSNFHDLVVMSWYCFLAHSIGLDFLAKVSYLPAPVHDQSFGSLPHVMCCHQRT